MDTCIPSSKLLPARLIEIHFENLSSFDTIYYSVSERFLSLKLWNCAIHTSFLIFDQIANR